MFNNLEITDIKQGCFMKKWMLAILGIFMVLGSFPAVKGWPFAEKMSVPRPRTSIPLKPKSFAIE